jgi:uncharacterized protein YbjT (DUF2867 family)
VLLVLGGSGYTGLAVTRALAAGNHCVRAFVRDETKAALAAAAGATEIALGDFRDLRSVAAALRGVDGVFFIGPRFMPQEAAVGKAVIDLAREANVSRFVFSGVYHPSILGLTNHWAKIQVEDHLYRTDLEFVVLQPSRFMHGPILSSRARLLAEGVLTDAFAPHVRMAYVDYRDVAEVAAIALTEDRLVHGTFELSAPGEPTLHEFAAAVGTALGKPVVAMQAPLELYGPAGAMMAEPYAAEGFKALRRYYDEFGFHGGNSLVLEAILRRKPTDIATCAGYLLGSAIG